MQPARHQDCRALLKYTSHTIHPLHQLYTYTNTFFRQNIVHQDHACRTTTIQGHSRLPVAVRRLPCHQGPAAATRSSGPRYPCSIRSVSLSKTLSLNLPCRHLSRPVLFWLKVKETLEKVCCLFRSCHRGGLGRSTQHGQITWTRHIHADAISASNGDMIQLVLIANI